MTVPALSYYYTSQREIESILSVEGAMLRTDDDGDNVPERGGQLGETVWQDILDEASGEIDFYLSLYYASQDLAQCRLIRRWASYLGAHIASIRRGNPGLYVDKRDEIIANLEKVARGIRQLPNVPTRADLTPAMSNIRVDDRFLVTKQRVQPQISTGGVSGRQHLDPTIPFEWAP